MILQSSCRIHSFGTVIKRTWILVTAVTMCNRQMINILCAVSKLLNAERTVKELKKNSHQNNRYYINCFHKINTYFENKIEIYYLKNKINLVSVIVKHAATTRAVWEYETFCHTKSKHTYLNIDLYILHILKPKYLKSIF